MELFTRKMLVSIVDSIWLVSIFNRKFRGNLCAAHSGRATVFFFFWKKIIFWWNSSNIIRFLVSAHQIHTCTLLWIGFLLHIWRLQSEGKKIMFLFVTIERTSNRHTQKSIALHIKQTNIKFNSKYCEQRYLPERLFYNRLFNSKIISRCPENMKRWNWTKRLKKHDYWLLSKCLFRPYCTDFERHQIIIILFISLYQIQLVKMINLNEH